MSKECFPRKRECLLLLRKLGVDENVVKHSIAVSATSLEIANKLRMRGIDVDTKLVEAAALLHDVGRSRAQGIEHGRVGGEILRGLGYPDSLAKIAENHVLCGAYTEETSDPSNTRNNQWPAMTLEEKIVCYSDKITLETKKTTLEDRFGKWFRLYGRSPMLVRALNHSKEIETELNQLAS